MKCRKCGALLRELDTFCSECGEKVSIEKCPSCQEILRPGVKFCSKCGYKIENRSEKETEPEDDDIPVTGQMRTADIPIDVIEKNILLEADRQVIENMKEEKYDSRPLPKNEGYDNKYSEDEYYEEYEEEDEYLEDDYYEDENYEDYYEEEEYYDEDETEEKSVISRLFTAAMIVVGLVILLVIAALFFKNRDKEDANEISNNNEVVSEEISDEETNHNNEKTVIGTITILKDANIRDYPSKDNSNVITTVSAGDTYDYYGYAENSEKWLHIKLNDTTDGYVYIELVKINE